MIVNTVKAANQLFDALTKIYQKNDSPPELKLIHSRFRPHERETWTEFLQRSALTPDTNRIIVATQVVEAGVDISASCLITELAPWTSLVQRFGRARDTAERRMSSCSTASRRTTRKRHPIWWQS